MLPSSQKFKNMQVSATYSVSCWYISYYSIKYAAQNKACCGGLLTYYGFKASRHSSAAVGHQEAKRPHACGVVLPSCSAMSGRRHKGAPLFVKGVWWKECFTYYYDSFGSCSDSREEGHWCWERSCGVSVYSSFGTLWWIDAMKLT